MSTILDELIIPNPTNTNVVKIIKYIFCTSKPKKRLHIKPQKIPQSDKNILRRFTLYLPSSPFSMSFISLGSSDFKSNFIVLPKFVHKFFKNWPTFENFIVLI